ncbi:MAG: DUF3822 family protein [Mameliella sp.]|nr:DUF3822 family protein [Phaeodactylibacter sp.]
MGKISQQLISPTFESSHTNTYELSILVGVDSFGFAVLSDQQRLLALRQYSLEGKALDSSRLEQIVRKDDILSSSFRNCRVAFASQDQVIVPKRLYNPDDLSIYLQGSTSITDQQSVLSGHLRSFETYLIYSVNKAVEDTLRRLFSGTKVFHIGHALVEGQRRMSKTVNGVYFHLLDGHLFASAFDQGKLLFFQAYRYRSAKDFVYYAMLVFDQAGLKADITPVFISGQLVEASEIYRLLSRYLTLVEFMDTRPVFKFDVENDREVAYQYFDLLSLSTL